MSLTLEQFDNAGIGEVSSMLAEIRATIVERDEARAEVLALRKQLDDATALCHGLGCGRCESCVNQARAEVERLKAGLSAVRELNKEADRQEALRTKAALESLRERCALALDAAIANDRTAARAAEAVRAVPLEAP